MHFFKWRKKGNTFLQLKRERHYISSTEERKAIYFFNWRKRGIILLQTEERKALYFFNWRKKGNTFLLVVLSASQQARNVKIKKRQQEVKKWRIKSILCQSLIFVGQKFNSFLKAGNHSRFEQAVTVVEEEDVDVTGQLHLAFVAFAIGITWRSKTGNSHFN